MHTEGICNFFNTHQQAAPLPHFFKFLTRRELLLKASSSFAYEETYFVFVSIWDYKERIFLATEFRTNLKLNEKVDSKWNKMKLIEMEKPHCWILTTTL